MSQASVMQNDDLYQEIGRYGLRAAEAFVLSSDVEDVEDDVSAASDVAVSVLAEFGISEGDPRYDAAADWFTTGWDYVMSGDALADAA